MRTAVELLAELRENGFTLATEGDSIRVAPASRLTAELRDAIRACKAELLAALDAAAAPRQTRALDLPAEPAALPADPAELQAQLDALTADAAWARGWAERLKAAQDADLDAVRRTIGDMLNLATDRHRVGDAAGFSAWARFALNHAAGRHWDEAALRPVAWSRRIETIT